MTETRAATYPARAKAHVVVDPDAPKKKRSRRKMRDDPGGRGVEIARELVVCAAYASAEAKA